MSSPAILLQRIQALEAKVNTLVGASSATVSGGVQTANSSVSSFQVGPFTYLSTPELIASGGNGGGPAVSWTTYSSVNAPPSATCFLILVTARRGPATTGEQYIYAAAYSGGPQIAIYGSNSDGVDTDTEGSTAVTPVPAQSGSFQYYIDAGMQSYNLQLVGWA